MRRTNACLAPNVVSQYASCFGTCCLWSCYEGYHSTGTYPSCNCVVDQPNHSNRVYSYTQGMRSFQRSLYLSSVSIFFKLAIKKIESLPHCNIKILLYAL